MMLRAGFLLRLALSIACDVNALGGLTMAPTKPALPYLSGSSVTKLATEGEKLLTTMGFMACGSSL